MSTATLAPRSAADEDDDFAPLDIKVVVATHPNGKLTCTTGDGCGDTCADNASACTSYVEDPA
ncbi:FxLD family lantipeptide [Streptomyces griseocarneus]|nr:FxLD family lantipeptide [Streptomyces griseocarneus]